MNVFCYDKSFEGLLTVIFEAYSSKIFPDYLLGDGEIPPMLMQTFRHIPTKTDKAQRVFSALQQKLSRQALRGLLLAWLSEQAGWDTLVYKYICLVIDSQKPIENDMRNEAVFGVSAMARKVMGEKHLMTGFVRFQKTVSGVYVGLLAPRYNVLALMLDHFAERFAGNQWILYDMGRKFGFLYSAEQFHDVYLDKAIFDGDKIKPEYLDKHELWFQNSWKNYCSTLSIEERKNTSLQRRCMPKRYWKYMVEMQA